MILTAVKANTIRMVNVLIVKIIHGRQVANPIPVNYVNLAMVVSLGIQNANNAVLDIIMTEHQKNVANVIKMTYQIIIERNVLIKYIVINS